MLESKVDTKDVRTMAKIRELEEDIENEKIAIKAKFLFKYAMQPNDPLGITEWNLNFIKFH